MKDYILLEHFVSRERRIPRIENVNPSNPHRLQEVRSKRLEVTSVAETPWSDGNKLATRLQESAKQREKGCVKIAGFNPNSSKVASSLGVAIDFPVRWIYD